MSEMLDPLLDDINKRVCAKDPTCCALRVIATLGFN